MSRSGLLALLVLVATVGLRLHGLSRWSLDGDELYSWFDVQDVLGGASWPDGVRSYPVGYLLMAGGVALLGLSEGALRAAPASAGVLAVAALLFLRRDVVCRKSALFTGALAAVSPWLVYHAQTARFYAPLLLFATLATLWALPGPGRRPKSALLAWLAAVGCHPTALLLGPALVSPVLLPPVRKTRLLLAVLGLAGLAAFLWSDAGASLGKVVERALSGVDPGRYDARDFVLGLGYAIGPVTGLLWLGGTSTLRRAEPALRLQLVSASLLPAAVLLAASLEGVSIHQRYAMASVPALLLVAGLGLAQLARTRPRTAAGALAVALLAWLPAGVGLWGDGNRHDVRAVAATLAGLSQPDDNFVGDEHATIEVYLHEIDGYADTEVVEAPIVEPLRLHTIPRHRKTCWLALKVSRLDGSYGRGFMDWVGEHFVEVQRVGADPPPLVRHDNRYVIYERRERLPPEPVSAGDGEDGR